MNTLRTSRIVFVLTILAVTIVVAPRLPRVADSVEAMLIGTQSRPQAVATGDRKIFVQYHPWYLKDDFPPTDRRYWSGWSQLTPTLDIPGGVDPTHFKTPWSRVIASRLGLPLTGPYSSLAGSDDDTIAYGFRVAKQAGIDGMFTSILDGGQRPRFAKHLNLAIPIGMPLGLELYYGNGGASCTETRAAEITNRTNQLTSLLQEFKDHPAYLKIDGKPVVWIVNQPICPTDNPGGKIFTWGTKDQLTQIINNVKATIGDFSIVMTGPSLDNANAKFSDIPEILRVVGAQNIVAFWGMFGHCQQTFQQLNATNRSNYENLYQTLINNAAANAGDKFALHVYPAFDERGLYPTTQALRNACTLNGSNVARTVIGRDGNGMYEANDGFLKAALDKAVSNNRWVFLESFNDWQEQTQIEPAFHTSGFFPTGDYFSALRRIADFKGISNVSFELPGKEMLDPPLVTYCRQKQWGNLTNFAKPATTVRLQGKFGLGNGAQQSNGIAFIVTYLDDDGTRKTLTSISKKYTGSLASFDIDVTPITNKRGLEFGIDDAGNSAFDWPFVTELKLNWYGQEINLLNSTILSQLNWRSAQQPVAWGTTSPKGTALFRSPIMEDGIVYSNALYLAPDFDDGEPGYMHADLNFDAMGAPRRVMLTGTFGFGQGAQGTTGVGFNVSYLEDDRSYQSPSYLPATFWQNRALVQKQYDGTLKTFNVDITPLLDKPAIVFGFEDMGNSFNDWVYLTELKLNWYGQEINLLNSNLLSQFNWHSSQGAVTWGTSTPKGTALLTNITMENGTAYSNALYLHPDFNNNGFMHSILPFDKIKPLFATCQ